MEKKGRRALREQEEVLECEDGEIHVAPPKRKRKRKGKAARRVRRAAQQRHSEWETLRLFVQKLLAFDFTFDGFLPMTLVELERIAIYTLLLLFAAYNGVSIPARLDSSFQNLSLKTGFSVDHTTFHLNFSGFSPFSQRVFIYGRFFRRYLAEAPDEFTGKVGSAIMNLTLWETMPNSSVLVETMELDFDADAGPEGLSSDVIPMIQLYNPRFTKCDITVDVFGNLGVFDTLQVSEYAQNSKFTKTQYWYRLVFVVASVVLLMYHKRNGESGMRLLLVYLVVAGTITCYGPMGIALFCEQNEVIFVADVILNNLYSMFVYNLWVFMIVKCSHFSAEVRIPVNFIVTFVNLVVVIFVVVDAYERGLNEFRDINSWASAPMNWLDYAVFTIYGVLLFVSYLLFVMRRKLSGDGLGTSAEAFQNWVDLPTYTFFVAQFCHIFDEVLIRMKIMKCMCLGTQLRQFAEVSCIYMMTFNRKDDIDIDEESDHPLSDVKCEVVPDVDLTLSPDNTNV